MAKFSSRNSLAAVAAAAASIAMGCGGNEAPAPTAEVPPAAPAAPSLAAQIAARTHFFGAENVDSKTGEVRSDLTIFSWASNTTYAAAINGRVVLLDAALLRREVEPGRTPTTLAEMVDLMPSHIFLGKAAPGYADLAANIAFRTKATVVGASEHCDVVEADARRQQAWTGKATLLKCFAVAPKDQATGKVVNTFQIAEIGACLRVIKNNDQNVTAADLSLPASTFNWADNSDPRDATYWPVGTAATDGIATTGAASGPSLLYHVTIAGSKNFAMVWHDRSGSLKENAPGVAALLRTLPKTDVQIGSVDVSNATTNGLRDTAWYVQAVQPKIFFMTGHDAAAQRAGAFNTAEVAKRALLSSMTNIGMADATKPEMRVTFDPSDYIKPHFMTFDPAAAAWNRVGDRLASSTCE